MTGRRKEGGRKEGKEGGKEGREGGMEEVALPLFRFLLAHRRNGLSPFLLAFVCASVFLCVGGEIQATTSSARYGGCRRRRRRSSSSSQSATRMPAGKAVMTRNTSRPMGAEENKIKNIFQLQFLQSSVAFSYGIVKVYSLILSPPPSSLTSVRLLRPVVQTSK